MKKKILPSIGLISLLVFSYWSIASLFLPGFFPMHDDTQVARVFEMAKSLADGMFPVRWVSDLGYGYGYPIFTFYGPLAYYIGAGFTFLGATPLFATKLMIIVSVLLSGVGMYYLAKTFWGEYGAIVAAILYVYAPYHAVNIYVRGAVGELFGYAFIPFLFFGLVKLFEQNSLRYFLVTSLALALLISSHNLTALMVSPFLFFILLLMFLILIKRKAVHKILPVFLAVAFGVLLSAFYWLPALSEMNYTNVASQIGKSANFHDHFICPVQLWESQWGFGGSARGCVDGLSFRVGKIHIIFSVLALIVLIAIWKDKKRALAISSGIVLLLLSLFLSLSYSETIWNSFTSFAYIQYPWRFLTFVSFFASFLAGSTVWFLMQKISLLKDRKFLQIIGVFLVTSGVVVFYGKLFTPQTLNPFTSDEYTNINRIRFETSRVSDEYMPKGFSKPTSQAYIPSSSFSVLEGEPRLSDEKKKTQSISVSVASNSPSKILAHIAYFPSWHSYIDGKEKKYQIMKNGLSLSIPKGNHKVEFHYESTTIELFANLLTLIGVVGVAAGIIVRSRKRGSL